MKTVKLYFLQLLRTCIILYCKWFKKPTIQNIAPDPIVEQSKIVYYNSILDFNQRISNQKRLMIDLQDRKDFLERTIYRLKTSVEQSEERDQMICLWEDDLKIVDDALITQAEILQNLMLEYVQVKQNGANT